MAVADLLRDARERRGLTLEQLAHETRIPVDRLTAFEHEGLPPDSGFYHRAQIRAYAHALSLDERRVLEALNQELAVATPLLPQPSQARASRIPVSSAAVAFACVMAVAFLSGTLLKRQMQTAPAESVSSAPGSDRTEQAVRVVQENQAAPSAVARASLPVVDAVDPVPAPPPAAVPAVPTAPVATQLVIATQPEELESRWTELDGA